MLLFFFSFFTKKFFVWKWGSALKKRRIKLHNKEEKNEKELGSVCVWVRERDRDQMHNTVVKMLSGNKTKETLAHIRWRKPFSFSLFQVDWESRNLHSQKKKMASPRLILHLDVNKTLVIGDIAGGKTLEDIIESTVAERVWGRVNCECWIINKENITQNTIQLWRG